MLQGSQCWVIHVLLLGGALCVRHVTTSHGYRSIPFSLRMHCSIISCHMWLTCHRYRDHCLSVDACSSLLQTTRHVAAFALSIHLRSAQCLSIACVSVRFPWGGFLRLSRPGCLASSGLGHYHIKPLSINILEISFNPDLRSFVRMPHPSGTLSNCIMEKKGR